MSKIRQREFQRLFFYDKYGHVFRVDIFVKNVEICKRSEGTKRTEIKSRQTIN